MKRFFVLLIAATLILPIMGKAEAPLGSKENPVPVNTPMSCEYETTSFTDYEQVKGKLTITVVGQLSNPTALETIYKFSFNRYEGSDYHCIKVLVEINDLSRSVAIPVSASAFKAYDDSFLFSENLTPLSVPELLNGTKAYVYLGFRTPEGHPGYIAFNNQIWFDLSSIVYISE